MANTNPPSDPPPSISAAELRRRLLASTPPPIAAVASTPDPVEPVEAPAFNWNAPATELLSKLRMPGGKSGSIPVPAARVAVPSSPVIDPPAVPPISARPAVNRRTPAPGVRLSGVEPTSAIAGVLNQLANVPDNHGRGSIDDSPMAEIQRLRSENKELRALLEEMKHLLQEASDTEQQFNAKEKEYLDALDEKERQVQELSTQLVAIEDQIARGELAPPPPAAKTRTELEEWSDELEKENARLVQERKRLDEERRQLHEDEDALESQMREMEVCMARERALLARQETELKRLSAEIQHELDLMQRGDAGLREQMAKFQRRAQEVMSNRPPTGGTGQYPNRR